ncbi:hypothetical protein ACVNP0_14470 [Staphylococcus aureus]
MHKGHDKVFDILMESLTQLKKAVMTFDPHRRVGVSLKKTNSINTTLDKIEKISTSMILIV